MRSCWQLLPDDRPSFAEIINQFEKILQSSADYLDLSQDIVYNTTYLEPSQGINSLLSKTNSIYK